MTAKELRELRAKLVPTINELRDKSHSDAGWTAEERANWEKVNKDYDALTDKINVAERAEGIEVEQRGSSNPGGGGRPGRDDFRPDGRNADPTRIAAEQRHLALQAWARQGTNYETLNTEQHIAAARACGVSLTASEFVIPLQTRSIMRGREMRALASGNDAIGGYTIAEGFVPRLERALLQFGGVMNVAEILRTEDGRPMPWPTTNDTSNEGERLGENTATTADSTADVAFGSYKFGAHKYSSKAILVPYELMRDNSVNLANMIGDIAGERLGRRGNRDLTLGSGGANEPQGIVAGATLGVTAASATAMTYDELLRLEHSVDPAYRESESFGYMMHDGILLQLRLLKDGNARPLWQSNVAEGRPDLFNGRPLQVNQHMASSLATGAKTVLCGDFSRYKVREVGAVRLRRLEERYAEKDQTGFIAFMEWDGALLDAGTHPVKYLQQA